MKFNHLLFLFAFLGLFSCQSKTVTLQTATGQTEIASEELLKILGESYVYGYPLILMDLTKRVSTNIEKPHLQRASAPVNQLGHFRKLPDHTLTAVVKPNVDTYYSIAWLDLAAEPQVLLMPATERYYLLPMLDAYSNVFASPGTRTTGTGEQTILIAGPNWKGETPQGLDLIQAPTEMVWMLGRIQANNSEGDARVVRAIQDSMSLIPLSAYGKKNYTPPIGKVKSENKDIVPVKTIQELDVNTYFNRMVELMVQNPPTTADSAIVKKMARIGLVAGQPFNLDLDDFILNTKLKALPNFVHKKMKERRANPDASMLVDGWVLVNEGIGTYGTDYLRRAYIDFIGLGACIPEDAVYPNCTLDTNGNHLDAQNKYKIHFEAKQIPPAHAFWSLTAYNADEFLVENELNRFALGNRDDLKYNKDGSLDLYIQSENPSKENFSNWLPIPKEGAFSLTLRLYWPKEEVLKGNWKIPAVKVVE